MGAENRPETIYHYTSVAALPNVLEESALWATHYAYLNDSSELRHGVDLMHKYVADERRPGSARGVAPELHAHLLDWLQKDFPIDHNVFVCCFSAKGNLLSQWRSYTPPKRGLCIGFSFDRLEQLARDQGFVLCPCEYDPQIQAHNAALIIDEVIEAAIKRDKEQSYYSAFRAFTDRVIRTAIGMKHKAFEEESEWRLVTQLPQGESYYKNEGLQFRNGESSLVPYIPFKLRLSDPAPWPFASFRAGPTPYVRESTNAVYSLLKQWGINGMRVSYCNIPFRS